MAKELELYIHIPFCIRKCAYCDFLSGQRNAEEIENYVEALISEIKTYQAMSLNEIVRTVFLGGGTPSILSGSQMKRIFQALRETFDISETAEITVEANPGTVTYEKLTAYRNVGINRISFGLQSANDEELKRLGRIHTFEEFLESYKMARACGFQNINVDLISAIPKQTTEQFEQSLKKITELQPEHVSVYSLIIEEGTPFAKLYGEGAPLEKDLPSEEEERLIYWKTKEFLEKEGYRRYEISNYAKEGLECRHNLGYWERKNYLGLGLGASSLMGNVRYHNTEDWKEYIANAKNLQKIQKDVETLTVEEQMEEFIFLGLRKMQGISEQKFQEAFQKSIWECYSENIRKVMEKGLLDKRDGNLYLTEKGIDISNYVFAEILCKQEN
mgnify:FL=1